MAHQRKIDQDKELDESKQPCFHVYWTNQIAKPLSCCSKWEKLYGEEAKHVKASIEAEKAREERKLARQLKKSASGGNKTSLGKQRRNASDPSKPTKAKPSDEQLHPSWEAKKLQQDLMAKALSGSGGLANKKIVFEDSD